jgi:hypothetical protein
MHDILFLLIGMILNRYWLFHYPRLSFLIGLLIFSLGEGLFYFGCCILSILFIAMTDFEADKRIQEEMEYTTGNSYLSTFNLCVYSSIGLYCESLYRI